MSGRRTSSGPGDSNPWVRRQPGAEPEEEEFQAEEEPPISPWNYPVHPPPTGVQDGPGGVQPAGPPSLKRPPRESGKPMGGFRRILLPILAAVVVIAVIGTVLLNVLGGDDSPSGNSTPTPSGGPSSAPSSAPSSGPSSAPSSVPSSAQSTYVPPSNAIPIAYGVSVVPAPGWTVFTPETEGKELVPSGANSRSTWFWVRQKQKLGAEEYAIRIFEGESQGATQVKASATRRPACQRDVLTECVSIGYTMVLPKDRSGLSMRCEVQAFRRNDGVVTAMDFCTRPDSYAKTYADARKMLQSVIDSQ